MKQGLPNLAAAAFLMALATVAVGVAARDHDDLRRVLADWTGRGQSEPRLLGSGGPFQPQDRRGPDRPPTVRGQSNEGPADVAAFARTREETATPRLGVARGSLDSRAGQGGAPAGGPTPPAYVRGEPPEAVFVRAAEALEAHETITARLRYRAHLFGQQLTGSGSYVQGPWRYRLLRLELRLAVGEKMASIQHVGDNQFLWIYRDLPSGPELGRVELARVTRQLAGGDEAAAALDRPPLDPLGLGGLPHLLRSLAASVRFESLREDTLLGTPVLVLEGSWRSAVLARLLPEQAAEIGAGQGGDLTELPPHVPDRVRVYLGTADLFPFRIDYLRTAATLPEDDRPPAPAEFRSLVALELFEVRLNAPVDSLAFIFNPGNLPAADVTDLYLSRLAAVQAQ